MSIDLESRLHSYGAVLDAAIESDLSTFDNRRTSTVDDGLVGVTDAQGRPPRATFVAVSAAVLLVVGCLALLADRRPDAQISPADTSEEGPASTASALLPATTAVAADDPETWDFIRVAPGTVGWYEFGDPPATLASRVADVQSWTFDYAARFYRCDSYTVDADGPICTGLIGGNFVAPTTFAGTGELGTHLGDLSTADLAWTLAQGSLWGYGEIASGPPATVAVGDHAGLMYSNADTSYLVWEQVPGVHLWIRATGFNADDMVALALTVRPATLPDHLPLAIVVDSVLTSGARAMDDLLVGSHHGGPLCAQVNIWDGCVALPPVSDVAVVVGTDGVGGPLTAVAAVYPVGSTNRLHVDVADGDPVMVESVQSPLGFEYSIFRPGTADIVSAQVVASDGSIISTATLTTAVPGPTTSAANPIDERVERQVHPEVGTYVLARGDYPSTRRGEVQSAVRGSSSRQRLDAAGPNCSRVPAARHRNQDPAGMDRSGRGRIRMSADER